MPKNKSDKAYAVPINNAVRAILQERAKLGTSGFVLDTTNLRKDFEQLREAAGIGNCTIHDLRHTFASHLAPDHKKIAVNMLDFVSERKAISEEAVKTSVSA